MLEVELVNCTIAFEGRRILSDVSTRFVWPDAPGSSRVIGLMGPSGSGKTTLARGLIDARYGARRRDLKIMPGDAVVAYLPQTPVLFTDLSVAQNAKLLATTGRHRHLFDPQLFEELVRSLHLEHLIAQPTHVDKLSGGEAQRLMLLRTLSIRPDLLILDEPATGLDPTVREAFLIDLTALLARLDIRALYVSHHWEEISFLCSYVGLAIAAWPRQPGASIDEIPILPVADFAAAPPTTDAFIAVHGPGCSALRLDRSGDVMAYISPVMPAGGFVPRPAGERCAIGVARTLATGGELRAALYSAGRFVEWSMITNIMLADPLS